MNFSLETLRTSLSAAAAVCIFALMFALSTAPARAASRLGMRGLKRQRSLSNPLWALVEPLVRWLGTRLRNVVPEIIYRGIDRRIVLAGDFLGLLPDEYLGMTLLSAVAGFGLGKLAGGVLMPLLGTILGGAMTYMIVEEEIQKRLRQIGQGLPYAIDLLSLCMSAGLDFPNSIRHLVEKSAKDDYLHEELNFILQKLQLGHTRKQALVTFAERAPIEAVQAFVSAIVQAEERGNPVAAVLRIQAETFRIRRSSSAEVGAAKASVKMMVPLVLCFLCVLLLIVGPVILKISSIERSLG